MSYTFFFEMVKFVIDFLFLKFENFDSENQKSTYWKFKNWRKKNHKKDNKPVKLKNSKNELKK